MSGLTTEAAPGTRAPRHVLPRLGGGEIELPGPAPLTFLVFYKASCPTCRWAMPFVQNLYDQAEGLRVLGVASDPVEEAAAFAEEVGLTFPVAVESEPWSVSAAYGLTTVPTAFLIDGAGKILLTSPGFAKDDFLEVARRAAEARGGEPVDPFPETPAVPPFRPG